MKTFMSECSITVKLMLFISLLVLVPVLIIPFYPSNAAYVFSFILSSLVSTVMAISLFLLQPEKHRQKKNPSHIKDGGLIVLFIWIYGFVIGALPFVFSKELTFVQALFESVSGWTTTGLSVMDVSKTPMIFLFHRSFMQFCGGLGFVLMMLLIKQGKESMSLFNAEGHPDKLMPNLSKTARTIFMMYMMYLGLGTLAYIIGGMNGFDALTHAMCALSTGGFSTQVDSIGAYDSVVIEAITIILMLIGTTNFAVLLLLSKRKLKQLLNVSEVKFMAILILIATTLIGSSLCFQLYMNVSDGFRQALFNVVSAISTSGFSTTTYHEWPVFSIGVMIGLMIIGGGIGSTAGGLKLTRVYLGYRLVGENIRKRIHSVRTISNPYFYTAQGKRYMDTHLQSDTIGFIFLYLTIFIMGSLLLTLTANCSLSDAMFEFASSLSTVGLSIGLTGSTTNNATLIVEMIGMLLGRLEIFIVIIGINTSVKKLIDFSGSILRYVKGSVKTF